MTADELLIHELAERAGISVRTIRYYIEEGLLPQPTYQGKYSYYDLSYLDRLELIRRLKESYLPLREIKEIMSSLTDEQVRARLKELPPPSVKFSSREMPSQAGPKPGAKALDYINRLMEDQTRYRTKGPVDQLQPNISNASDIFFQQAINQPQLTPSPGEQTWQRIELAPGVELHLRIPLEPDVNDRVRQIIGYVKRIFSDKSQGGIK